MTPLGVSDEQGVGDGTTDVRIYKNDIFNIDHGYILSGSDGGSIGDIWFDRNHVHDTALWDSDTNAYHHDGIHCYTGGTQGMHIRNFYIYDNRFDGKIGMHMTGWVFLEGPDAGTACNDSNSNIWIFNNVATASDHATVNPVFGESSGHLFFVHNTVGMPDPTDTGSTCMAVIDGGTFVDNAVGGCNRLVTGSTSPAELDYNAYADCTGSYNCFSMGTRLQWTSIFAKYRSQFPSLDAHSVFAPSAAAGSNAAGVSNDLHTMCSGNLEPLCRDIRGALRPIRMAPDAGAYQQETAAITADRIGNAQLGALQKSVEHVYGKNKAVHSRHRIFGAFRITGTQTATYRRHHGLLKVSYARGRVAAVSTTSLYYVTPGGLGVGADEDTQKLIRSGWRTCGPALVKRRGRRTTALRIVGGRVTALAVSQSRHLACR